MGDHTSDGPGDGTRSSQMVSDLLWCNYIDGTNAAWLMNGVSLLSIVNLPTVTNTNLRIEAVADYNGDGKTDLVWRNCGSGANAIWLMNGTIWSSTVNLPTLPNLSYRIGGPR